MKSSLPFLLLALLGAPLFAPQSLSAQDGGAQQPERYRARHILIPWKGSPAATPETKLSKDEAKKKAEEVFAALKGGGDFAALAKAESSCPSKHDGGYLGQFQAGRMVPAFEQAVKGSEVGEVVGPVETQFGWHVIQRMPIDKPWPAKIAASHILIAYKDAMRARDSVERSQEDALALAKKLLDEIRAEKVSFEDAAKKNSDDVGSGARGGDLGTMPTDGFVPTFTDALVGLDVGQLAGPIETAFGYHIIRRNEIVLPMRASHVLIPWKGASSAPADVTRTKAEALALAKEVLERATKGENFGALAKAHSSCPSSARGGDLGEFQKGQMVKPFEEAVQESKVGDIVGPIETRFGWHIIQRTQ